MGAGRPRHCHAHQELRPGSRHVRPVLAQVSTSNTAISRAVEYIFIDIKNAVKIRTHCNQNLIYVFLFWELCGPISTFMCL